MVANANLHWGDRRMIMTMQYLFTSESVSEGHPDKLADTISDAVLDYVLTHRSLAHVACEVLITRGLVVVAGEIEWESSDRPALEKAVAHIVEATLVDVGYDPANFQVQIQLARQSPEIRQGVRQPDGIIGAGDQGLMFGYATNETATLMPLPLTLAHALMGKQSELRHCGALPWLRLDAKAQVSVLYDAGKPLCVETVVLSTQHSPDIDTDTLRSLVSQQIIERVIPESLRSPRMRVLINPTGRFEIGGPEADTGLTGRKIIVDTYGGSCPHGGGAFSGKDPTKVDR
jgi:S-adenosylmethionine synthetase